MLAELGANEAERRRLERRRVELMEEAWEAGATQTEVARRLGVSQATFSRQLARAAASDRSSAVAAAEEAVDAYEAGRLPIEELIARVLAAGQDPIPALDRGIVRGTLALDVVRRIEQARSTGLGERDQLARMDFDLLDQLMRVTVEDAVRALRVAGGPQGRRDDLARRGRAARRSITPDERIDLILECRAILAAQDG